MRSHGCLAEIVSGDCYSDQFIFIGDSQIIGIYIIIKT